MTNPANPFRCFNSSPEVIRLDFPSLKRRVIELAQHWRPRSIIVEDKGAETALIQQLRSESLGIP